jgi:hypothetical protein
MKKVLHFKIPTDNDGNLLVSLDCIEQFAKYVAKHLSDEYKIFFSPFSMQMLDSNGEFIEVEIPKIEFQEFVDKYLKNGGI